MLAVRLWNAFTGSLLRGYDDLGHVGYILYLDLYRSVPWADQGWSYFHPPLHYAVGWALAQLDSPGGVSLVVTDVVMPEMGGRQMWERLSEQGYDIPVIVMSGYPNGRDTTELVRRAATFLQKPFAPRELLHAVRDSLENA